MDYEAKEISILDNSIHLSGYGYEADILQERGANLISFSCPDLGVQILRTPKALDDFTSSNPYLYGIPVLFPPNRISNGRFMFENREYIFPVNEPDVGNFLHGSIHETAFECISRTEDAAEFEYRATVDQPYLTFPHAFMMRIKYQLRADGIFQCVTIKNESEENMPVALGFHTTFSLPFVQGGELEDLRLIIDAQEEYIRDMRTYLPTGEVHTEFDIKDALNQGGIVPSNHSISRHFLMGRDRRMKLVDVKKNIEIIYRADECYRYWMVYNGGHKDFICVEPQTWLNNAPNAPFAREKTGLSFLKPGEQRNYTTSISIMSALDKGV